jgi:hypothetical protein
VGVGAAGAGSGGGWRRAALTPRTTMKTANATIRKLMMVLRKTPMFTVTAPASLAWATEA